MDGGAHGALIEGFVAVAGARLEYALHGEAVEGGPTLVLLHEGLGCVAMWRAFPEQLAHDTGARVLVYSRRGYGRSDPASLPRPLTYMHDEALVVLPQLLNALGIDDAILVGHSDGASIALIFAGASAEAHVLRGIVLLAPHVFCEDVSVASIAEARVAFEQGGLREKLARYHGDNTDGAFYGWNDAWLDPTFRRWNLQVFLPNVRIPVLVLQGDEDRYGTLAQVTTIEREVSGPCEVLVLARCGHDPTRDALDTTRAAIARFVLRAPALDRVTTVP